MPLLSKQGRTALDTFATQFHQQMGVTVGAQFAVEPRINQTLHDKIIEDGNWFLGRINMPFVTEKTGQKIHMGVNKLVTRRTDTSADKERVARSLADLTEDGYTTHKQDTDIGLRYEVIDSWAHFPDFASRYQRHVRTAIGNDLLRIGWHGTSAAADTDPDTNVNGEDVNIGWLQQIKDYAGNDDKQHLDGNDVTLTIGTNGAFKNLDSLVTSMKHDAIALPFQSTPMMTVIVSADMAGGAEGQFHANNSSTPSEKVHVYDGKVMNAYGGLPMLVVPFLPSGTVLITPTDNLSIYTQASSRRRSQMDNAKKDQYEDFNSAGIAYVVEQLGAAALATGVTFV